jgi:hypothetical protein
MFEFFYILFIHFFAGFGMMSAYIYYRDYNRDEDI